MVHLTHDLEEEAAGYGRPLSAVGIATAGLLLIALLAIGLLQGEDAAPGTGPYLVATVKG